MDNDTVANRSNTVSGTGKTNRLAISFLLAAFAPVLAAVVLYQLDSFDPAPLPTHEFAKQPIAVPRCNPRMLQTSDKIGSGQLLSPEDVAYNPKTQMIYTGCVDGWVKRVRVNDSVVENWVNTGGRPLGIAFDRDGEVIVADADEGLLKIAGDGVPQLLTDEADGLKFRLTDDVDVAEDGTIYFTDASYKYSIKHAIWDILEARPHGRLLSYDPSTQQTKVLLCDLYFANGVAVSPDQNFVIYCETPMRRCRKYHIRGERKGSVDVFMENLPGFPDNIRYDGEGHYWIALATGVTYAWDMAQTYPFIRKVLAILAKYNKMPSIVKDAGVLAANLEGKPMAHYYDPGLSYISSGIKIGDHLYCGSILYPYIIRLNLTMSPALPIASK